LTSAAHVKAFSGVSSGELLSFYAFGTFAGLHKGGTGHLILPGLEPTGSHGSGTGAGKVAFQDLHTFASGAADDPIEVLVGAGGGAPGGHVKVFNDTHFGSLYGLELAGSRAGVGHSGGHVRTFDGLTLAQLDSFFVFPGFNGGVFVASGSESPSQGFKLQPFGGFLGGTRSAVADIDASGHGTHVAGTIGSDPSGTVHTGAALHLKPAIARDSATGSSKTVTAVIDTGNDYSHPDLYQNIWINQSLERLLDDLASDVASRQHGSQR
jgi:hypothetical protein